MGAADQGSDAKRPGGAVRAETERLTDHWNAMVRAARGVLGTLEEAEECASEALLQVCEARPSKVLNMEAYLVTVAKRRAIDRLRHLDRARRRDARLATREALLVPDVAEDVARRDEARWMSMEAERLLEPRALELLRRVAEGDSIDVISLELGISTRAAHSALHRARKLLRQVYAKALAALGLGLLTGRRLAFLSAPAMVVAALVLVPSHPDPPAPVQHRLSPNLPSEQMQDQVESPPRGEQLQVRPPTSAPRGNAVVADLLPPRAPHAGDSDTSSDIAEVVGPLNARVTLEERNDQSQDDDDVVD